MIGSGVIIGIILIVFGIYFNNFILIVLGFIAAVAFALFHKPEKITYVEVESPKGQRKPRHIIIKAQPPELHYPMPWEMEAPFSEAMRDALFKKDLSEMKKLKGTLKKASGEKKKKVQKKINKLDENIKKKHHMVGTFPFYMPRKKNPIERILIGLPINLFKKAFGKSKTEEKEK